MISRRLKFVTKLYINIKKVMYVGKELAYLPKHLNKWALAITNSKIKVPNYFSELLFFFTNYKVSRNDIATLHFDHAHHNFR